MAFNDIRGFLDTLLTTGDAVRIEEEVDWDLEVGAINRLSGETNGPAACFEHLKGYPPGYRILLRSIYGRRRTALALELSPETSWRAIKEELGHRQPHRNIP